jgi:hypothetical protein
MSAQTQQSCHERPVSSHGPTPATRAKAVSTDASDALNSGNIAGNSDKPVSCPVAVALAVYRVRGRPIGGARLREVAR